MHYWSCMSTTSQRSLPQICHFYRQKQEDLLFRFVRRRIERIDFQLSRTTDRYRLEHKRHTPLRNILEIILKVGNGWQ